MNQNLVQELPPWNDFALKRLDVLRPEFEPYHFQYFAVYRALIENTFVIGLATGLGKTLCAYLAYFYWKLKYPNTKLIIFTKNSAVLQFRNELDKFFNHDLKAIAIHKKMPKFEGRKYIKDKDPYPQSRKHAFDMFAGDEVDVLIMNYAICRKDRKMILSAYEKLQKRGIEVFPVFDEGTEFKSLTTKVHYAVQAITNHSSRALSLTATLTKGKLEEIYGIYRALGFLVADTKEDFEKKFCTAIELTLKPTATVPYERKVKKITGYKNTEKFVSIIRPVSLVLRKKDVAKFLPAITPQTIFLEHSPEQIKLIGCIMSGMITQDVYLDEEDTEALPTKELKKVSHLTEVQYIKRALQDPRLVTHQNLRDFTLDYASPKTQFIIDRLQNEFTGEKIIVYSPSKMYINLLRDTIHYLAKKNAMEPLYSKVLTITGDIPPDQRERNKSLFTERPDYNLMLINDAGSDSINLQAASVLMVVTLPKTGGDLVQLVGRYSRLGSTHSNLLLYYLMIEDSQDWDEYVALQRQMQIMSQVIGEAEVGLLDLEVLKKIDKSEDLSDDTYRTNSTAQLLFYTRKRRHDYYFDPARMYQVEE